MRKLILQVQLTLDGFVAGPEGQLDWMWLSGDIDPAGMEKVIALADSCDTILMGRKMTPGFVKYWESVVDNQPGSGEQPLAQRMVNMQKIVFSKTLDTMPGRNLRVENGDLGTVVQSLKQQPGKDMIAYGGATFASALISLGLVDAYYIFLNPVAIGQGLPIFKETTPLQLENHTAYKNGKMVLEYLPVRKELLPAK
ncbi:dihydrofolate reductase family protein [Chitinophaga pollutisoli]|uniref:Dihydrofolate reductase family protein n=1 Tax=Chitinophaga pollutisoli TaxID=3133966 RepID=A0ABZ2YPD0_9BACT